MNRKQNDRGKLYAGKTGSFFQMMVDLGEDHISAYAAQAAFFLILSLIPIIILILTMLQYTPVTEEDFMNEIAMIFPGTILPLIENIISEVYTYSTAMIPLNLLVALWSAGKGVMAISKGLNCVHDMIETRNYFLVRFRATFYTVLMIIAIILSLVLQVFGLKLAHFLTGYIPIISHIVAFFVKIRNWISIAVITLVAWVLYVTMPNKKIRLVREVPGAVFTALGWTAISWLFTMYLEIFKGFQSMYGSMATLILIMLWLYFEMMILLLGAEINQWIREYDILYKVPIVRIHHREREQAYIEKVRQRNMELLRKQSHYHLRVIPGIKVSDEQAMTNKGENISDKDHDISDTVGNIPDMCHDETGME